MFKPLNALCILLLALANIQSVKAEFLYNPIYNVINAPNGVGSASVTISNPTNRTVRMQLSLTEWHMSSNNEVIIDEPKEGIDSAIDYIKLNPRQFTLGPMQKRVVRLACALPANFPDREYRLLLNMLEIGAERQELDAPDKYSFGLIINRQISAGTYVRKGKPGFLAADLKIKALEAKLQGKTVDYTITYQNLGNRHTRRNIGVKFFDSKGQMIGEKAGQGGFWRCQLKSKKPFVLKAAS